MHNKKTAARMGLRSRVFEVFQARESLLRRFLRRYTSDLNDIEDMTQETIARVLAAEREKEIHEPYAFIFGVAKNVARRELEKKSRSVIDLIEDLAGQEYLSDEPELGEQLDSQVRFQMFCDAVAALPARCQKVFVLKRVYGYSHKEIARCLGISESTVEKHAAEGLRRCDDYMRRKSKGEVVEVPVSGIQKS